MGLTSEQLDELDSRVECRLLRAGDAGWDDAVLVWNGMVAKAPALVLQPTSAGDVVAAVRFARDHGLVLSIKGGGHNMAGTAIAERGLTLDMSRMRDVSRRPACEARARRGRVSAPGRRPGDTGARTGHAVGVVQLRGRRRRPDARRRVGLPHASLRLGGGQPRGGRDRHRGRPDPHGQPRRERRPLLGPPGRWGQLRRRHPVHVPPARGRPDRHRRPHRLALPTGSTTCSQPTATSPSRRRAS